MVLLTAYLDDIDASLAAERPRLVRLCATLTGSSEAAEDLAQETLVEAWRHLHKLHDPRGLSPWLTAIARNVCLRWARNQARELRYVAPRIAGSPELDIPDAFELEVELERDELAEILDQALALLPSDTRDVLVQRYIEEKPQAEVAAWLGLSEGAVAMRLRRGKLALQRLLTTNFREQATAFGLTAGDEWQETRIWCPVCGHRRVMGRFVHADGNFTLRCPACTPRYRDDTSVNMAHAISPEIFGGVRGFKPALSRLMAHGFQSIEHAVERWRMRCPFCGAETLLRLEASHYQRQPAPLSSRGLLMRCEMCQAAYDICLSGVALWHPEGRRFWALHQRIRLLPERQLDRGGRPATVFSFESLNAREKLDVVVEHVSHRILEIHHGAQA